MLIGEPYWRQLPATEEIAQACGVSSTSDFLTLRDLSERSTISAMTWWKWYWQTGEGWDRYEAAKWLTMRRWLEANPDDDFAAEVRAELNIAPKRYVTYARECFGWGVFALIAEVTTGSRYFWLEISRLYLCFDLMYHLHNTYSVCLLIKMSP